MSRYDGLIIPRSYSEYINKTDAATLLQALQLSGVMDNAPTADSVHPVKSGGVYNSISTKANKATPATAGNLASLDGNGNLIDSGTEIVDIIQNDNMNAVTSNAVYNYLPFRIRSFQKKRVIISSINSHGYAIKTLSEMGFSALDNNYIVSICNNIAGGAGISVIGNGTTSLMFFNSAGENKTNVTIDVIIIYLI